MRTALFQKRAAVLWLVLFAAHPAHAQDGRAVMQAVYDQGRIHENQKADVRLVIADKSGRTRERFFRFYYKIFSDRTKSLLKFDKPNSVKGTGMLNETEDGSSDTSQWMYLPALRSVRQLSSEDKHKSFVGSDFTNADVAGREVDQDSHTIITQDKERITVRSVPKDKSDAYAKLETIVLRAVNVPESVTFYKKGGAKLKTLHNRTIRKVKGMYTVTASEMVNHQTGGTSAMTKSNFTVTDEINAHEVGFKGLKR